LTRFLLAGGWAASLMGATSILPVVVAALKRGGLTNLGIGVVSVGCSLIACGMTAVLLGFRQRRASGMPSGVRMAVAANIFFLAFFALELSDRLVRQDGKIFYWTTFLFLPALVLFYGLLAAGRWAWWTSRGLAALGVLWFLGFVALIPFVDLHGGGGPVPWYGRIIMACVSLAFAGVLASAFWSLGRTQTRCYFGLIRTEGTAEPGDCT
jgi:hypothetical protein